MPIRIPEPCTENWSKMTSTERGAFCGKCAKEVIDFTAKTPTEITSILSNEFRSGNSVCGRIRQSQMDTINDEDFVWTSEKQRFQVLWMYSIIAVFGLTLFSCQNTVSKEVVEQMQIDAQEILAQENESDSASITENPDPKADTLIKPEFLIENPWPWGYELVGLIPLPEITSGPISICPIFMGGFSIVLGNMAPSITEEEKINEALIPFGLPFADTKQSPQAPHQYHSPRPNNEPSMRNDIVYNEDFDDFFAYISPVPITENSRVIVEVFRSISLNITLQNKDTETVLGTTTLEFEKANYAFNPNFHLLAKGNYTILLESERTRQSIQFSMDEMKVNS